MFNWFKKRKSVMASKRQVILALYHASGMRYNAKDELDEPEYVLVPDSAWVLRNCPQSRQWRKGWDCTKIAIDALARLQTHACGAIKVSWPDKEHTHALIVVVYENHTAELFDPHSREFHSLEGHEVYKLWM